MTQQLNAGEEAQFERYALYWTPEHGSPLAEFGRSWLGYDADTGNPVDQRDCRGLGLDLLEQITTTPRHYGFHGTLLSPYRLRDGKSANELLDRMQRFAARRRPVEVGPLQLERLFDFLALVPKNDVFALSALHAECAFAFDPFWAPLTEAERARHSEPELSWTQRLMLAQWGYPRMLSEFPFHLTLTGSLDAVQSDEIMGKLAANLDDVCGPPLTLESISLCGDPGSEKPFRVLARFPFDS